MIVNRDYEKPLEFDLALKSDLRIYEVSREDGEQRVILENSDKLHVSLDLGDAILIRMQPMSEEAFTCEYKLVD